jgi:UDP-N-acetylglucosamine 2-epimerase (non-hydrolysing)
METFLIHTGQHYDWDMSESFLKELELPAPKICLNVRSGADQFGRVVLRTTKCLSRIRPDALLVGGDTNSGAGAALASSKLGIPVGHVEAGCRSFDRRMQEEINRLVISDCADAHFAATKTCKANLLRESIDRSTVFLTGHPVVETVRQMLRRIHPSQITNKLGLERKHYVLLTLHRAEMVDDSESLSHVVNALKALSVPIVFPVHPRTRIRLKRYGLLQTTRSIGVRIIPPISYALTLDLIANSAMVLTDSGGMQQECALLRIPCVTLRETTEWTETTAARINFLAPPSSEHLERIICDVYQSLPEIRKRFVSVKNLFGDGLASRRIVRIVQSKLAGRR